MNEHETTGTFSQTYLPTYSKPLMILLAACAGLLAVGGVLDLFGYGIWAGLFGAMTVIFLLTIVIGLCLTWLLGQVSH